ncbi:MAG: sphingosine kinase, partial [Blastocatellia bacterium]
VQVDVGEVNDRIFLNNSSLGLYPRIVRHRERQQRLGVGKWPAYLWAGLAVLRRYPFVDVRLIVDGEVFFTRTPFVFIGNNVYEMEGFNVGTRARVDAGVLSLYVTNSIGRFGLLRLALRVLLGRLRDAGDLETMTTNETRVETRRRLVRVATDGEVALMPSPLHYRIRPGALRVLVPKTPNRPSEEGISDAKACASL